MANANQNPKQLAQDSRKELYYNVFSTLMRLQIEASPINYELMYEIIRGNNPELRTKFGRLGKNVTPEDLDELARSYLPHHFGKSVYDTSANSLQSELTTLKESLQSGQSSLSSYTNILGKASGAISAIDPADTKNIQSHLQVIRQATELQQSRSSQILDSVTTQLSNVDAMAGELEEFERMKFKHAATNLANRRAFNRRLAELFSVGRVRDETSLVLCNLLVLEPFEKNELLQAKELILQRLGLLVQQAVQATDFAAWLDRPQIALLLTTASEAEVERVVEHIRMGCARAFDSSQRGSPAVVAQFGSSSSYDAETASDLIRNAEKALEIASATGDGKVAFFPPRKAGNVRKDWSLYKI
jgi:diguanylate cyclase